MATGRPAPAGAAAAAARDRHQSGDDDEEPEFTATALEESLYKLHHVADCDIFVGNEQAVGQTRWKRVFGGQVLAQALVAAQRTVPEDMLVHSLHGYFILAGISGVEILFQVNRIRDGKSFCTRQVTAKQKNRAIFHLSASFHRREWGPEFQVPSQRVWAIVKARGFRADVLPTPEQLIASGKTIEPANHADNRGETESILVDQGDWWSLKYFRLRHRLPEDSPMSLHQAIFAWMTDSNMATIVCWPHVMQNKHTFDMVFSMDHSMHFHRPFRVDDWLLFSSLTTVSSGALGLARCEVFSRGELVATITQEALIRVPKALAREMEAKEREQGRPAVDAVPDQNPELPQAKL